MSAVNRIRTSMTSVIVSVLAIATLATAFRDNLFVDIPWQTWLPMLAVLAASGAAGAVGVGVAIIMKRPWALGFAWGCLASMTLLFLVYAGASRFFALVVRCVFPAPFPVEVVGGAAAVFRYPHAAAWTLQRAGRGHTAGKATPASGCVAV